MIEKAMERNRAELVSYCLHEPLANLFLLADIQNFGFDSEFQEVWRQLDDTGRLCGVLLRYHFNYLYYSQTAGSHCRGAGLFLRQQSPRIFSAKPELVEAMAEVFGDGYRRRNMTFAGLENGDRLLPAPEGVQKATEADALEIARQYEKIEEFKGLYPGTEAERAENIRARIASGEGEHYFLRRNGEIAAHANSSAENGKTGAIGGVFALPAYRRQGLAGGVVSALCRSMLARGVMPCLLFDNPDAGKLYFKLGFAPTGSWATLEAAEE